MQDTDIQMNKNSIVDSHIQSEEKFLEAEIDVIGEVGNMSMGAAATVLSELLGRKVTITAPVVECTVLEQVKMKYPIPCVTISVEYSKGLFGTSVFVIKEEDALLIAQQMVKKSLGDIEVTDLDELALSALGECMNQMMGASATSLARFLNHEIDMTPPKITRVDFKEDIESVKNLVGTTSVVETVFKLSIEDLVQSNMLQLMRCDFAKMLSDELLKSVTNVTVSPTKEVKKEAKKETPKNSKKKQTAQKQEPVAPASRQSEKEDIDQAILDVANSEGNKLANLLGKDFDSINIDLIKALPVDIKVVLGQIRIPLRDLISLGKGFIVELDTNEQELVDVKVNNCLIAKGEIVVVNEQYGVRIVEIVNPRERLLSFRQE
jgi:flagellar motor switch protein FliN/FliY